jgi:hypothetical protein
VTNPTNDRFSDWTKDANGNLKMNPIVGWQSAVFAGTACMLRIEFVHSLDQFGKTSDAVQLAMTPAQAKELSDVLLRMADKVDLNVPPGTPKS